MGRGRLKQIEDRVISFVSHVYTRAHNYGYKYCVYTATTIVHT